MLSDQVEVQSPYCCLVGGMVGAAYSFSQEPAQLRSRFRKEYLSQLVQKAKATCQELKVGDIVLIELENKKRVMWPMGKIEKIYSSRDGASRVVQVRTSSGCLTRPIQKLYPLEVSTSEILYSPGQLKTGPDMDDCLYQLRNNV
ncbi:DUF5641 domain-containing protein [Caerostris extrusa]|uniref:DUF5641 domain-containing protein n=1 Tax=Caerostris extrusa TaxID=172846 RepID=A0AAV4NDG4_CAEEX|nr:DUF5641 domain-containing protein [Caerostris extrusa]